MLKESVHLLTDRFPARANATVNLDKFNAIYEVSRLNNNIVRLSLGITHAIGYEVRVVSEATR